MRRERKRLRSHVGKVALLLLLNAIAFAQTGAISGTIADEFGEPVSGASVTAKDATGKEFKSTSAADGTFTIGELPPGTYDLIVRILTMKPFDRMGVVVGATQPLRLDIVLRDADFGTLGDGDRYSAIFFNSIPRKPAPEGPIPRLADGKPDLSGFWAAQRGGERTQPEPLPWAEAIRQERQANNLRDDPYGRCLPRGIMSWAGQGKFVHTPAMLLLLSTGEPARQVFLDGREHPKELNPTWQGHSVGHWEGDTLVVDTVGFNGLIWYGAGIPATEILHVTERYHRTDLGHLEMEITVEDSAVLRRPWVQKQISVLDPTEDIREFICTENNKDVEHMVGK